MPFQSGLNRMASLFDFLIYGSQWQRREAATRGLLSVSDCLQKAVLTAVLPVDIPTGWEPRAKQSRAVALLAALRAALRVAFADFSASPWQGFEKSERGPNNSSLFQPLAAVVAVAVRVLLSAGKRVASR